jgi:hypothetical protein
MTAAHRHAPRHAARFELRLDGAGGIFAFDHALGRTYYTQHQGEHDIDLLYAGVRLVVPALLPSPADQALPAGWSALRQLERAQRVVLVLCDPAATRADDEQLLAEHAALVAQLPGWSLLRVDLPAPATQDAAGVFRAVLGAVQQRWLAANPRPLARNDDAIGRTLTLPQMVADVRQDIEGWAQAAYTSRDYARKRRASFVSYHADNAVASSVERARELGREAIDGTALAERIDAALHTHSPFSFVRVGEGEGCFLSYQRYMDERSPANEVFGVCAKDIFRIWFARNIHDASPAELGTVRDLFWNALRNADVIGVPTVERVLFEHVHCIDDLARHGFNRGYIGVVEILHHLQHARSQGQMPQAVFSDCDIARPLYEWQDWRSALATTLPRMLQGRREVTLVSCHAQLGATLQRFLDIGHVRTLRIPPERGRVAGQDHLGGDHYADHFASICDALRRDPSPLVVVAAGFLGKAYCAVAKQAGSVAVDIGSLADHWAGHDTRAKNAWNLPSPFPGT